MPHRNCDDIHAVESGCHPVPDLMHASPLIRDGSMDGRDVEVEYTCNYGYRFNNGGEVAVTWCDGTSWKPLESHCEGVTFSLFVLS